MEKNKNDIGCKCNKFCFDEKLYRCYGSFYNNKCKDDTNRTWRWNMISIDTKYLN